MRTSILALLAAGALLAPRALPAASLRLSDGATLRVTALAQPGAGAHSSFGASGSLMFSLTEPGGRVAAGLVPGSEGASPLDVSLARNPRSGDVVMAFARPGIGGRDIVATTWTGQAWSEPIDLSAGGTDESSPILAFRPQGDAVVAWTSRGSMGESVLLRHFELGAEIQTYSFVDAGSAERLAGDAAATSGSAPQVLGVVGGPDSLSAYLLVGTGDRTPLSVVRLGLDAILDAGGFGAAPVPVSFIRSAAQGASSGGITGRAGESSAVGEFLAPWRMVVGSGEAWYWADEGRVVLATFVDGTAGRVVTFDVPATEALLHVEAYRIARAELGSPIRRVGGSDVPAGIRRLR